MAISQLIQFIIQSLSKIGVQDDRRAKAGVQIRYAKATQNDLIPSGAQDKDLYCLQDLYYLQV